MLHAQGDRLNLRRNQPRPEQPQRHHAVHDGVGNRQQLIVNGAAANTYSYDADGRPDLDPVEVPLG